MQNYKKKLAKCANGKLETQVWRSSLGISRGLQAKLKPWKLKKKIQLHIDKEERRTEDKILGKSRVLELGGL